MFAEGLLDPLGGFGGEACGGIGGGGASFPVAGGADQLKLLFELAAGAAGEQVSADGQPFGEGQSAIQ